MSIKISYLIPSSKNQIIIGRLVFLKNFKKTSIEFPYFYFGERNEILNQSNWPDLVPYLYEKKINLFVNNQVKDNFSAYAFSSLNGNLTLEFRDPNAITILKALNEDRELHYIENNNTYSDWYRTITPLSDISFSNKNFLLEKENYRITDLNVFNDIALITVKINIVDNVNQQILNNKNIEFGLYRMENTKTSLIYNSIKSKYFSTPNNKDFVGGLRTRSQIIGHTHSHVHNMNQHTHTMIHRHNMSNHTHPMQHNHGYLDSFGQSFSVQNGPVLIQAGYADLYYGWNVNVIGGATSQNKTTNDASISVTAPPNTQLTGTSNINITSAPNNNFTSNILSKTTSKDNIYTDDNNFKIDDKNYYNSDILYLYIYGGNYIP